MIMAIYLGVWTLILLRVALYIMKEVITEKMIHVAIIRQNPRVTQKYIGINHNPIKVTVYEMEVVEVVMWLSHDGETIKSTW